MRAGSSMPWPLQPPRAPAIRTERLLVSLCLSSVLYLPLSLDRSCATCAALLDPFALLLLVVCVPAPAPVSMICPSSGVYARMHMQGWEFPSDKDEAELRRWAAIAEQAARDV